jgi:hypothetical protein
MKNLRLSFLLVVILFFAPGLFAKKYKPTCKKSELETKNCYIKFKSYSLQLTQKKITVHDGVWRSIFDFPIISEKSNWHKVVFQKKGGKHFLNLYIWDAPVGETQVQSLKWLLISFKTVKSKLMVNKVVWKRYVKNLSELKGSSPEVANNDKNKKIKYGYESRKKHGYRIKGAQLNWWSGYEKGVVDGL